jgi:hypothetical protein
MLSAEAMGAAYRALLAALERRSFPFAPPLRLSRPRKLAAALGAVLRGLAA